mmetsp:Transcript_50832/g.91354  ORF Transcript_50832/g.91354 Transcript_50832/m.91354 type:complete len:528 (-) Transcript_50832:50-1633(-)
MWLGVLLHFLLASAEESPETCFLDGICVKKPWHLLGPQDVIEPIPVFTEWKFAENRSVQLAGQEVPLAEGLVEHSAVGVQSAFDVLAKVVTQQEVADILRLLEKYGSKNPFDSDPDTVDGMSTHEVYVETPDMPTEPSTEAQPWMKLDTDPRVFASRKKLRRRLKKIMDPIVKDRITPFVQERFPSCRREAGNCTPCYSLVRKYKSGERRSHGVHYDAHALVTVVISLKDYGASYRGGLYVATSHSRRNSRILGLLSGDAVIHQSDLLHGVEVDDDGGERWSWILWFRDTPSCDDSSEYRWFRSCAREGNAVCQFLHANKAGQEPEVRGDPAKTAEEVLLWNQKAADQGFGPAMVKLARAYLKTLPSSLPYDEARAIDLFQRAINATGEPDAYYGLATLALENQGLEGVVQAVQLLLHAARGGHVFSMFNLGLAHLYGYAFPRDPNVAAQWFLACGLPEGLAAVAIHRDSLGDRSEASLFQARAIQMGYGSPWRKISREKTGSGGASGVDINLPWPPLPNGLKPEVV